MAFCRQASHGPKGSDTECTRNRISTPSTTTHHFQPGPSNTEHSPSLWTNTHARTHTHTNCCLCRGDTTGVLPCYRHDNEDLFVPWRKSRCHAPEIYLLHKRSPRVLVNGVPCVADANLLAADATCDSTTPWREGYTTLTPGPATVLPPPSPPPPGRSS